MSRPVLSPLARVMGRWTITALVVNAILGSGVFGLPSVIAGKLGALAPAAWIVGALGNVVIILCFAEVASRFSDAGGAYLYARAALPRPLAIQVGWFAYLTRLTAAAAGANLFTSYAAEFVPAAERAAVRVALLTLLLGPLALINVRGVRHGAVASNLFTAAKLVPLATFVLGGALLLWLRGAPATPPALATSGDDWLSALLLIVFAYGGYDGAMMAMGEAREPRRDAPFALLAATLFLAVLYTSVQWVVSATLADPAASQRPLAAAAEVLIGPAGANLMAAGALLSVVGFLVANFLNAPRLTFALAVHFDFPSWFGRIHPRFRTPYLSILAFGFLVWALALYGNFRWNATLSAVARLFVYAATCIALLILRRRGAPPARLRVPGGTLLAVLGLALCALLVSRMGRSELLIVLPVAAIALANWLAVRRVLRPAPLEDGEERAGS